MLRLFILRAVPLFFRPTAVLLEGVLIHDGYIIVLALPVAMLALTISSVPIYLDYFKTADTGTKRTRLGRQYVCALTWITLFTFVTLWLIQTVLPLNMGGILALSVCFVFLTEKLADETSRSLEFRKAFVSWFMVQFLRSGWLLIPVFLTSTIDAPYLTAFFISSIIASVVMFAVFIRVTNLFPCFGRDGLFLLKSKLFFVAGSIVPAAYRQIPRILVAKLFPDYAHTYLAMAQLAQGAGLLFNVKFQIPYRKAIARKTVMFQTLMQPVIRRVLLGPAVCSVVYLVIGAFFPVDNVSDLFLAVILGPILLADALTFACLAAYLGYLPWFGRLRDVLKTYLLCSLVFFILLAALDNSAIDGFVSPMTLPAVFILAGLVCMRIVIQRHFRVLSNGERMR